MFGLLQWGVTILAAAALNLYYIRRDITARLVQLKVLGDNDPLPLQRWIFGTLLLILLAAVFSTYMKRAIGRHILYRTQLLSMNPTYSGIMEELPTVRRLPAGGFLSKTHYLLFFAFPGFDLFLWAMSFARSHFQISW